MRRSLSDRGVASLRPRAARYAHPDPELKGLWVRIQPSGSRSFYAVTLSPAGKQVWTKVGDHPAMSVVEARKRAAVILTRVRDGLPATEAPPDSFGSIAASWLQRHVEAKSLRSASEIRRILDSYVLPHWRDRPMVDIRRSDMAALLDRIEDRSGPRSADLTAAWIKAIAKWHETRNDTYVSPFRASRRSTAPARSRILDDRELALVWRATELGGPFGAFVRLALLTGQRSEKIRTMRWDDIDADGTWTIATSEREKGNAGTLRLPPVALEILGSLPREGVFVFQGKGTAAMDLYSSTHDAFRAKLPADMPPFTIHDLRRTSRSLLSRAGIRPDIAERVMGHGVGSAVEATYDRHAYTKEIGDALARLAALIGAIVDPTPNVVPMERKR